MSAPGERGTAALRRALATGDPADLDEAVTLLRQAGEAPGTLSNLGAALRTRYRAGGCPADLDEAVDVLAEAVARTDPADPWAAGRLGTWGIALGDRYERTGDPADLHASVAALEQACAAAQDRVQVARQAANLAGALLERFRAVHDPGDLERAVDVSRAATAAAATPDDRAAARRNLAAALHERFRRTGDRADLDAALAAALPDDGAPLRPRDLGVLGILLHTRFVLTGDADDLENAVAVLTAAEQAGSGHRTGVLGALGTALLDRFRWTGDGADLDAAIGMLRSAVAAADRIERAARLSNLGVALAARPEHDPRTAADLREALARHAEAVDAAGDTDPDLATILANRAGALLAVAETLGDETLDAAADGYRRAAALTAGNPAAHATHLAQLALVLRAQATATGDAGAAREAVRLMREVVELAGPGHRDHRVFCSQLGSALVRRHLRHGAAGDLTEAIAWHDRAVAGLVPRRVGAARWLAARAHALRLRAEQTRLPDDVTTAVDAYRAALDAEADAGRLPDLLAALGSALDLRRDGLDDLTATIAVRREAVRLARPDDPMRGPWLADLANSLRLRGNAAGDAADLEEAHRLHVEAVASTPDRHPEHATVLSNLAGSHRDRYVRTGDDTDLDRALDLLLRAAATAAAPAQQRFVAAETAARLAADTGQWSAACAAYEAAIDLLPAAAWRGADRAGRERPLRATRWLAAEAAAAALRLDAPGRALVLLERGRTVLWNQRTETGADLTVLRRAAPALADRLDAARAVLDAEPDDATGSRRADSRISAAAAWDAAVAELQARPELAEALLPAVPLRVDAGTVVFVLVSRYGRHALLLDGDGPRAVPLTRLDLDALADRLGDYYGALDVVADPPDPAQRRAADRRLSDLLGWLGEAVVDPVLDAVTAGPRVWWCPTGLFTAFPLHAAGSAPERVVSSYTPTVTALLRSRTDGEGACRHVVGVAAADVAGGDTLPGVAVELDELRAALPAGVAFTRLDDATRAAVTGALRGTIDDPVWAHLACHAEQDLARPSRAAFLLADGRLGLTDVARGPRTPAAGAYLSACHSALGGADLADEALHLAAAMQHAGYRRVVATLWPVNDRLARTAAGRIYRTLCADGTFRPDRSAAAVHDLMLGLRARDPATPSRWAPFVHLGP